jgi:hypothetical protein
LAETVMVGSAVPPDGPGLGLGTGMFAAGVSSAGEGCGTGVAAAGVSPAVAGCADGGIAGVCAQAPMLRDEIKNDIDAIGRERNNTDTSLPSVPAVTRVSCPATAPSCRLQYDVVNKCAYLPVVASRLPHTLRTHAH